MKFRNNTVMKEINNNTVKDLIDFLNSMKKLEHTFYIFIILVEKSEDRNFIRRHY